MSKQPDSISGEDAARKLISLTEAANLSGLTTSHLRRLARGQIIWATKKGRDWFTTEEAITSYIATDRRTGPKPKD